MTPTNDLVAGLEGLDIEEEESPAAAVADIITATPKAFKRRDDPSLPHYPRGLILDLALRTAPVSDLIQAYRISVEEFKQLANHPVFRQELRETRDRIKEEGFSFKVKAQAQAEAYLAEAWNMVHDKDVPASTRSQLIQWTAKVAGLETPTPSANTQPDLNSLAAELKNLPAGELEVRALSIIMRKAENAPRVINGD